MGDGKTNVLFIFLTIVVFLVLGAINGLLAYNFMQKQESLKTQGTQITLDINTIKNKLDKADKDLGKYKEDVAVKRLEISQLLHKLTLAKATNKDMVTRVDYRDALVKSMREMTSNLAGSRDTLVSFFDTKREEENERFRNEIDDYTTKVGSLETRKTNLETKIEDLDKQFNKELTILLTKVNQVQQDIQNAQNIKGVIDVEEEADGKIFIVDNVNNFVIVNAGVKNGIKPGQRFKVFQYDSNRVPQEKGFIICRTIEDYISYAQIVNVVDKANPILEGDYIASPIYSRTQTIKIAVIGEIRGYRSIDEESKALLAKKLRRDIEEFGAVFSETVTPDCVLCVVSKATAEKPDEGEPTPDVIKFRRAKEFEIPIMFEDEFLRYISN